MFLSSLEQLPSSVPILPSGPLSCSLSSHLRYFPQQPLKHCSPLARDSSRFSPLTCSPSQQANPATNTSHLHSTLQFMTCFWASPATQRQALQKTIPSTLEAKKGKETCSRSQSKKAGHKPGLLYHKLATFTASQPQGPGHTLVSVSYTQQDN